MSDDYCSSKINVEAQWEDEFSVINSYRDLVVQRRVRRVLVHGYVKPLVVNDTSGVLAYVRLLRHEEKGTPDNHKIR